VLSENEYLFHKTTYRDVFTQAREQFPQAPDVVLWNERGELTETTTGNLVIEIDGRLVTPPISCGLLPGTFRAHLLAQGVISEAPILRTQVTAETKAWMINSVRRWVPVVFDFSSRSTESAKKPSRQS
jgi:para-aminobenzoate synthetase/4-amino-4-deoxychorismate lyase